MHKADLSIQDVFKTTHRYIGILLRSFRDENDTELDALDVAEEPQSAKIADWNLRLLKTGHQKSVVRWLVPMRTVYLWT